MVENRATRWIEHAFDLSLASVVRSGFFKGGALRAVEPRLGGGHPGRAFHRCNHCDCRTTDAVESARPIVSSLAPGHSTNYLRL